MLQPSLVVLTVEQILCNCEPLAGQIELVVKDFEFIRAQPRPHVIGVIALDALEDDMSVRDEVVVRPFCTTAPVAFASGRLS